ncbi:MAG: YkgJ family cysteine cluster protein, partial [Halobacteriota archaeon]
MAGPRPLEEHLAAIDELSVERVADAIEAIGFECTRCGACCRAHDGEDHVATVFPEEARHLEEATGYDWRDVVRPMPFGLDADGTGETIEWTLATDGCGDCRFLDEGPSGTTTCSVYADRPAICRTYPFSLADDIGGTPMGATVDRVGPVRAHECEGLGRDIDRASADRLAEALIERARRSIEEAMAVRAN